MLGKLSCVVFVPVEKTVGLVGRGSVLLPLLWELFGPRGLRELGAAFEGGVGLGFCLDCGPCHEVDGWRPFRADSTLSVVAHVLCVLT